jgi:hypothetical protein
VLPTLVYEFEAIAVRVDDISCVVARVVVESSARRAIIRGSRSNSGGIGSIHRILAIRYETNVRRVAVRAALP